MLICIPQVLSKAEVFDFRRLMDAVDWEDGRSTAGAQSAMVKKNEQLPPDSDLSRHLGQRVGSRGIATGRHQCLLVPPDDRLHVGEVVEAFPGLGELCVSGGHERLPVKVRPLVCQLRLIE